MISQYGGFRIVVPGVTLAQKYLDPKKPNAYLHRIPFGSNLRVDIPHGFEPIEKYNATYGHKINHSFGITYVHYSYADTPRNGLIAMWKSSRPIKKGQQIFS